MSRIITLARRISDLTESSFLHSSLLDREVVPNLYTRYFWFKFKVLKPELDVDHLLVRLAKLDCPVLKSHLPTDYLRFVFFQLSHYCFSISFYNDVCHDPIVCPKSLVLYSLVRIFGDDIDFFELSGKARKCYEKLLKGSFGNFLRTAIQTYLQPKEDHLVIALVSSYSFETLYYSYDELQENLDKLLALYKGASKVLVYKDFICFEDGYIPNPSKDIYIEEPIGLAKIYLDFLKMQAI